MDADTAIEICRRWQLTETWIEAQCAYLEFRRATQSLSSLKSDRPECRKQAHIDRETNRKKLLDFKHELISLENYARQHQPMMLPMNPTISFFDDIYNGPSVAQLIDEFAAIEMAIGDPSLVDNWHKQQAFKRREQLLDGTMRPITIGDHEFVKRKSKQ